MCPVHDMNKHQWLVFMSLTMSLAAVVFINCQPESHLSVVIIEKGVQGTEI